MITLHQPPAMGGVPSLSVFCMKVEAYLRLTGLDYEVAITVNPRQGPKGKIPWIADGNTVLGDSTLIIEYLSAKYGKDIDGGLSPAQRAQGRAFRIMAEERLYWTNVYARWIDDENWPTIRRLFFSRLPLPLRWVLPGRARKRIGTLLYGHGLGRHSRDEIYAFGLGDIAAISAALDGKPYLLDDKPRTVDLAVGSGLATIMIPEFRSPLREAARADQSLKDYVTRVMTACKWDAPQF